MQVGVHYGGVFYEFVPWNGVVSWEISQWGYWHIYAESDTYKVIMHLGILAFNIHKHSLSSSDS